MLASSRPKNKTLKVGNFTLPFYHVYVFALIPTNPPAPALIRHRHLGRYNTFPRYLGPVR